MVNFTESEQRAFEESKAQNNNLSGQPPQPGLPEPALPAPPPMLLLRRPNRRSVLKNLTREFQQKIIDYLEGTAGTPRHTLQSTVEWLASQAIPTHPSALRDFRDWWEVAHQ